MQTNQILPSYAQTAEGQEAESILRKCVHCGFCQATCPTYQVLGDELDSPRGRIYLIKQVLEGKEVTRKTQQHLDRCLTCRNCETTCPSGVQYGHLVDIGRKIVDEQVPRPLGEKLTRGALQHGITSSAFAPAMKLGQAMRSVVPGSLKAKVPQPRAAGALPQRTHATKVWMLNGCAQPAMMPSVDRATVRVLDALGIQALFAPSSGCCGALEFHMNAQDPARERMRRNVDAWHDALASGAVSAVIMNASGCGATVREYDYHLKHDMVYADKAALVAQKTQDIGVFLAPFAQRLKSLMGAIALPRVAFHPPCTLSHWQPGRTPTEQLLTALGFELQAFDESHLCCGSAGAYSVLQPDISTQLRDRKLGHIQSTQPQQILTSNIGCMTHLQGGTDTLVWHWIEAVDAAIKAR